jgi:anthranilate/para-aminobenzoate synthase component I
MFVLELSLTLAPGELARKLAHAPGFAWLDSDGSSGAEARFSFLGAEPVEVQRVDAADFEALSLLDDLHTPEAGSGECRAGFEAGGGGSSVPAEAGGGGAVLDASAVPCWIGYIAYEAGRAPVPGPGLCFARYDALFAFDHLAGRWFVVGDNTGSCERLVELAGLEPQSTAPQASNAPAEKAPQTGPQASITTAENAAQTAPHAGIAPAEHAPQSPQLTAAAHAHSSPRVGPITAADPTEHARAIAAAKELIACGELYQVNLARKLSARFTGPPIALALAMRDESPVPLGMFFDDGERAVVARSMERFLRWKLPERKLHTRPIKGTRARAEGGDVNEAEQRALAADPKEHAEHAMIVDLMRNDLGRVAAIGSVEVVERFVVEPFARLHHLVSTVACITRPGLRASDILRATFPPGSVTGTPKLRAIEAIDTLEPVPRGIYTGAVGFIDRAGGLSLAVAIRTAVVENGVASYFAGGGIVEASDIAREIEETDLKARVFTDAIEKLAARAGGFEPP